MRLTSFTDYGLRMLISAPSGLEGLRCEVQGFRFRLPVATAKDARQRMARALCFTKQGLSCCHLPWRAARDPNSMKSAGAKALWHDGRHHSERHRIFERYRATETARPDMF